MTGRVSAILAGIVLAGTIGALAVADEPRTISGYVGVVSDGDTIILGGYDGRAASLRREGIDEGRVRVRLWGIDAPEHDQLCGAARCGHAASAALYRMIQADRNVTCEVKGSDRYGRAVAVCRNKGGDLGARMVALGWAIDVPRYSGGAYRDHEEAAKAERMGIHAGTFEEPATWRREHKR